MTSVTQRITFDIFETDSPLTSATRSFDLLPAVDTRTVSGTQLTGFSTPGSTVTAKNAAGVVLGSVTADAVTGAFTMPLSSTQPTGTVLTVFAATATGQSVPATVTVPAPVAPAAPSNLNLTGPTSGAYVLSGNGDAGSVVTVKDNAGTTVATATVSAGGSWSANIPTSTLGPLTLFATANALNSAQVTYSAAPLPMISNPAVAVAAGLMGAGLLLIRRRRNQSRA